MNISQIDLNAGHKIHLNSSIYAAKHRLDHIIVHFERRFVDLLVVCSNFHSNLFVEFLVRAAEFHTYFRKLEEDLLSVIEHGENQLSH